MAEFLISAIDDPRIAVYRELKKSNLTRGTGQFIAEGCRLVERLLDSDFPVDSILVSDRRRDQLPPGIEARTQVYVAPLPLLEAIIGYNFHGGMLACGRRKPPLPIDQWVRTNAEQSLLVGCPHIRDQENLGTLIRVAAAFGADGIVVGGASANPFSRRTLRISMGNAFFLPIYETEDFSGTMADLQQRQGFHAVATVLDETARPLAEMQRPPRLLLLFGNEDIGLSPELVTESDCRVMIPMAEKIDSLNVGISAGIFLHHFTQIAASSC